MATKIKYVAPVKVISEPKKKVQADSIYLKDAELGVLYCTVSRSPQLCYVAKKNIGTGLHAIVVWADFGIGWLSVNLADYYELTTKTDMCKSMLRVKPSDHALQVGKHQGQAGKQRKYDEAGNKIKKEHAAKSTGPNKSQDPVTGVRIGTRKNDMAHALLSSKDAKVVQKAVVKLMQDILHEKGQDEDTKNPKRFRTLLWSYIKWAAENKPESYAEILKVLEVKL